MKAIFLAFAILSVLSLNAQGTAYNAGAVMGILVKIAVVAAIIYGIVVFIKKEK
jgi:hypothetical protein